MNKNNRIKTIKLREIPTNLSISNIKTPDIIIDDSVSEEAGSDDWSSVPAFLRRNKR